jgi:hypothetical protein
MFKTSGAGTCLRPAKMRKYLFRVMRAETKTLLAPFPRKAERITVPALTAVQNLRVSFI